MNRIYAGKLSTIYPEQYEKNYYAGGIKGNTWYNGLDIGDYVFPIYDSCVGKLWKVTGFSDEPTSFNPEGRVNFEVVKTYDPPIPIGKGFARYRYFELNLIMLNKIAKSTAKEKIGFHELTCEEGCPTPENMDFNFIRNLYIGIESPFETIFFKEGDIRILLDNVENMGITDIQVYQQGKLVRYNSLWDLYKQKNIEVNKDGNLFSLIELLEYSKLDNANKKEKFLNAVIAEIKLKGIISVVSPIALYDNVLVGRKRTGISKSVSPNKKVIIESNEEETDVSEGIANYEKYKDFVEVLNFNPNLILYGPPGTGKTYSAQRIIEAFEYKRTGTVMSFEQVQEEDRVTFITFHQSFSYEEFVEGLRPVINDEEDTTNEGKLKYCVMPGVLLELSNRAARSQIIDQKKINTPANKNSRIWKISLGERHTEEHIYNACLKTNSIAIGWFSDNNIGDWDYKRIYKELYESKRTGEPAPKNDANSVNNFVNEIEPGDFVLVFASRNSIRSIGIVEGDYECNKTLIDKSFPHRRKVKWLKIYDTPIDIRQYNAGKNLSQVTLYELSNVTYSDIKEMLDEANGDKPSENNVIPYFLVIDEINRGNISKIFGEMITLIEKDKRDKLKVRLPYSQKDFILPSNLFIIGTMNTADRSIAVLDTALRRRFIFKEIEPDSNVLKNEDQGIDDFDLAKLLNSINQKISKILDRDHRIGHAYFINVFRYAELKIIWYYQIIPLLMEYFYNDPEKIASIITDAFIDTTTGTIKEIKSDFEFKEALLKIII